MRQSRRKKKSNFQFPISEVVLQDLDPRFMFRNQVPTALHWPISFTGLIYELTITQGRS